MAIGSIVEGTHRSRFLSVGLEDSTVRILSLEPNTCLELKSTQALPMVAESLNILEVSNTNKETAIQANLLLSL